MDGSSSGGREIWSVDGDQVVEATRRPPADWCAQVAAIEYGTDGLRYVSPDVGAVVRHVGAAGRYVALREGGRLLGTYLIVDRPAAMAGWPVRLSYRTALTVAPTEGGRGLGSALTAATRRHLLAPERGARVVYGLVDPTNTRSRALAVKAGYHKTGTLRVVPLLWPRAHASAGPVRPDEVPALRRAIEERCAGHLLFDLDHSLLAEDVVVWREDGKIVAAVQGVPKAVTVTALPPALGWTRHLGITLADRQVVQLVGIWCAPGYERRVSPLLAAAVARFPGALGVAALDRRDPVHAALLRRPVWAAVDAALGGEVDLWTGTTGVPAAEVARWADRPVWVSALDAC